MGARSELKAPPERVGGRAAGTPNWGDFYQITPLVLYPECFAIEVPNLTGGKGQFSIVGMLT